MSEPADLAAMLRRATDDADPAARESAFAEILDLLLIYVRAAMGRALRDHRDSADVCQSIARSLVEDVDAGKVRFASEPELRAYLRTVVRSRLAMLARSDTADKRGGGNQPAAFSTSTSDPPAPDPTPSENLVGDEALRRAGELLSDDDQSIARMLARGLTFDQIAAATGQSSAALRQRWSRAGRKVEDDLNTP
ncbi:MAG: RNA polymerase sigma factor [Phycisphaerales bacterium]